MLLILCTLHTPYTLRKLVTLHPLSNPPIPQALKQLGSNPKTPVVVLEPKTNTLLNGPNAPTQVLSLRL